MTIFVSLRRGGQQLLLSVEPIFLVDRQYVAIATVTIMDNGKPRPAVFFDRDGTICEEVGYLSSPDQLVLIEGAAEGIRDLNSAGILVVITTNQSGVARGYFPEDVVEAVHERMRKLLSAQGARVDAIYYCPHHPEGIVGALRIDCQCRKPKPGMIHRAAAELPVDLASSYVVGDKLSDIEFGQSAGLKAVLVRTGYGREEEKKLTQDVSRKPDYVADEVYQATQWILTDLKKRGVVRF